MQPSQHCHEAWPGFAVASPDLQAQHHQVGLAVAILQIPYVASSDLVVASQDHPAATEAPFVAASAAARPAAAAVVAENVDVSTGLAPDPGHLLAT